MRPIQPSDTENPFKLYQYLQEKEKELAKLTAMYAKAVAPVPSKSSADQLGPATLEAIRSALQIGGSTELTVDGLPGILAAAQYPLIPRVTALPDATSTLYSLVILTGSPDTLWVINKDVQPNTWTQLTTTPANMVTTDTVQAAGVLTGVKTWANKQFFAGGIDASGGQMVATTQFTARAFSSVVTACPTGGPTPIAFNQETYDVGALHNTAVNNSRMVIPVGGDGLWLLVGGVEWQNNVAGTYRQVWFVLNGATIMGMNLIDWPTTTGQAVHNFSTIFPLAAGNFVEIWATQDTGGALNVLANTATTFFAVHHLS